MPKHDNLDAKLIHWQAQHASDIYRAMKRLLPDAHIDMAVRRLQDNYLGDAVIAEMIDVSVAFVGAMRWYVRYGMKLEEDHNHDE